MAKSNIALFILLLTANIIIVAIFHLMVGNVLLIILVATLNGIAANYLGYQEGLHVTQSIEAIVRKVTQR
jgi:Na+/H+-dicarboxylate symporter